MCTVILVGIIGQQTIATCAIGTQPYSNMAEIMSVWDVHALDLDLPVQFPWRAHLDPEVAGLRQLRKTQFGRCHLPLVATSCHGLPR